VVEQLLEYSGLAELVSPARLLQELLPEGVFPVLLLRVGQEALEPVSDTDARLKSYSLAAPLLSPTLRLLHKLQRLVLQQVPDLPLSVLVDYCCAVLECVASVLTRVSGQAATSKQGNDLLLQSSLVGTILPTIVNVLYRKEVCGPALADRVLLKVLYLLCFVI
jgi:hypothetical protein